MRDALGGIDENVGADGVGLRGDVFDGVDGPQDVGHVGYSHQLGLVVDEGVQVGKVESSLVGNGYESKRGALGLGELLPGNQVAVVFHFGDENFVAGVQVVCGPRAGHQVYALGGVSDEDQVLDRRGADESSDLLAGLLVALGGLHAEGVDATMHVGVIAFVVVHEGLNDGGRLLGGGGVIQVDQGLAVDKLG